MAIIKCPECGHQISDKAPVCPNCGVEIAGKIIQCPHCGEVYFKNLTMCPVCHQPNPLLGAAATAPAQPEPASRPAPAQPAPAPKPSQPSGPAATDGGNNGKKGGVWKKAVVVACIIACLLSAVLYYYYHTAKTEKEQEAYAYAMQSDDPLVLQSYLDTYKGFDEAHLDSVRNRMTMLQQTDQEWQNVLVSNSKSALQQYLDSHPGTPHEETIRHKIDSIDWTAAMRLNSLDGYQDYLESHPNGEHFDEASDNIKQLKADIVQPEEETMVKTQMKRFFQAVNNKKGDQLSNTVSGVLTSFLGKSDATADDVLAFMDKQWAKDGLKNLNWYLKDDFTIQKKEIGDNKYDYTVTFTAIRKTSFDDASKNAEDTYRITAHVNPDGEISAMDMTH